MFKLFSFGPYAADVRALWLNICIVYRPGARHGGRRFVAQCEGAIAQLFPSVIGNEVAQAFVAGELQGVETVVFAERGGIGEPEGVEAGLLGGVGAEGEATPAFAFEAHKATAGSEE